MFILISIQQLVDQPNPIVSSPLTYDTLDAAKEQMHYQLYYGYNQHIPSTRVIILGANGEYIANEVAISAPVSPEITEE